MRIEPFWLELVQRLWKHRRIWSVGLVWLGSWWLGMLFAIHMPPWLHAALRIDRLIPLIEREVARQDPPLGQIYALPPLYDLKGRARHLPLVAGRYTCLLFVYHCSACEAEKKIRNLARVTRGVGNVELAVVVVRGQPKEIEAYWQRHRVPVPVLLDRNAAVAKVLNAVYTARIYLFDPEGRLRYLSYHADTLATIERQLREVTAPGA